MFKMLSENLNMLMAKARLTSSDLAKLIGVPATTIKRIKNNEQSNPTVATLLPIAKYFAITVSELIGCEDEFPATLTTDNYLGWRSIPVLSWSECIHYRILDYSQIVRRIVTDKKVSSKSYALTIEEQNQKFFPKNSYLIIDPDVDLQSEDLVINVKKNAGIADVKRYIMKTNQTYLQSLDNSSDATELTNEFLILGAVVQYKVDLKFM